MVVVIVALLVGWYGRMWREREGDRSVTRTRAANARKAVWHARWVIVVVGIVVLAIIDVVTARRRPVRRGWPAFYHVSPGAALR